MRVIIMMKLYREIQIVHLGYLGANKSIFEGKKNTRMEYMSMEGNSTAKC